MSIPLVQNNEKDSINTSIIAIKKNLERINSILGLVDSGSDIDTSEFVKKSDVVDVIQSDNMNPVTSNAVATSNAMPVDTVTSGDMHSATSNAVAGAYDKILTSKRLNNNASVYIKSDTNAFFNSAIIMVARDGLRYLSMGVVYWEYNNSIRVAWLLDHTTNIIEITKITTLCTQIKNISGYPILIILMNRGDFYFSDTQ